MPVNVDKAAFEKAVKAALQAQATAFTKIGELTLPTQPLCLCVAGDYLYVAAFGENQTGTNLFKIDLVDFTVVDTLYLSMTDYPRAIVASGNYLYVAGWGTDMISKVNMTTFTEEARLDIGYVLGIPFGPTSLAVSGGYLYAGTYTGGFEPQKVAQIDLSTFTVNKVLTVGGEEAVPALCVGPNNVLYAGLYTSPGKIALITIPELEKKGEITLNKGEDRVWSLVSDGTQYMYAGLDVGKIVKIDTKTDTEVEATTLKGSVGALDIDASAIYLYASHSYGVSRIDLTTFQEVSSVPILRSEEKPWAVKVYGDFLFATNQSKVLKMALKTLQLANIGGKVTTEDTGVNTNPEKWLHENHWESGEIEISVAGPDGQKNLGTAVPAGKIRRIREITVRHTGTNNTVVTLLVAGGATKLTIDVPAQSTRVWSSEDGRVFVAGQQPAVQSSNVSGGNTYVSAAGVEA